MDLRSAARALGGHVSAGQILCPGPGHSTADRSLSVKLGDDGPVVHSHAGDDWRACQAHVRAKLGLPAFEPNTKENSILNMQARVVPPADSQKPDVWTPIVPIPKDAPMLTVAFAEAHAPKGYSFQEGYKYVNAAGQPMFAVERYERPVEVGPPDKEFRPTTFCEGPSGRREWRMQGLPAPRPLYRLDQLAKKPDASVLIVEGEKTCQAGEKLFLDHVVVTWCGGSNAAHLADWSPLRGRTVYIWPDNDDAGRKAAAVVVENVMAAGAKAAFVVSVPSEFPAKWDVADAVPDGADVKSILAAAQPPEPAEPAAPTYPAGFRMSPRGLLWSDPSDDEKPEIVVSGPFEVLAQSRDDAGWSWGVLLRWRDPDGRAREWAMPRSTLASDGVDVRRALLDGGLYVGAGTKARNLLTTFLASVHVTQRARAVSTVGWYGGAFVFPDGAIGQTGGERTILQTTGAIDHAYNTKGTLADWQHNVARLAVGNSRLVLAISTAFAAALVGPSGAESGGIHLRGRSSIGKSTALVVAGSVWGGGDRGFIRAWRATSNGLEAVAGAHNDALLCLDELAQLSGREAGECAYMLANGAGKARASRDASARKPARWRLLFLSSGEIGLSDKIAEDARGKKQTAGQQVRVVDVPADTGSRRPTSHAPRGSSASRTPPSILPTASEKTVEPAQYEDISSESRHCRSRRDLQRGQVSRS